MLYAVMIIDQTTDQQAITTEFFSNKRKAIKHIAKTLGQTQSSVKLTTKDRTVIMYDHYVLKNNDHRVYVNYVSESD